MIHLRYGKPHPTVSVREYKSHSLAYDKARKVPVWVMESLTKEDASIEDNVADRKKSVFKVILYLQYDSVIMIFIAHSLIQQYQQSLVPSTVTTWAVGGVVVTWQQLVTTSTVRQAWTIPSTLLILYRRTLRIMKST